MDGVVFDGADFSQHMAPIAAYEWRGKNFVGFFSCIF
jgi:hypothetical protein